MRQKDPCPMCKRGHFAYSEKIKKFACTHCGFLCRRQGNSTLPSHMERRGADLASRTWDKLKRAC